MNPLKLFRKLVKLIRGGANGPQIVLGCLLGMIIGMVPGFNMTVVLAVLVLLLLAANFGLALLAFAIGKILCYALAPVTFEIGYAVIHHMGLQGLFRAASTTPVVALMDLHYYCVAGGLPLAIILGLAMGIAAAVLIKQLRRGLMAATGRSERLQRLSRNLIVRVLLRLVFGKQKKSLAEMLGAKHPLFRKSGVVLCAVLVVALLVFEFLFLDALVKDGIRDGLEAAVGAQVDVAEVDMSLVGGKLTVHGLQVTDPAEPATNAVQIETLTSDLSTTDLLAKQFVIDKLVVQGLRTGVKRAAPGRVYRKPEEPQAPITEDTISQYFEKGRKILEYLRKLNEYLDEREQGRKQREEGPSKEEVEREARRQYYLGQSAKDVLVERPTVTIRELEISDIRIEQAGRIFSLQGKDVSDKPELTSRPMTVQVTDNMGLKAAAVFNFHEPGGRHALYVVAPDVPLGGAIKLSDKVPLDIAEGTVDVIIKGEFTAEAMNLATVLAVDGLQAKASRSFLGLDEATTKRMLEHLKSLKFGLGLVGPIEAPRVVLDERVLLEGLAQAMKEAGQAELTRRLGAQLDQVMQKVPVTLPAGVTDLLPGLRVPGGGGKKQEGKDKPPGPGDLLEGLLP